MSANESESAPSGESAPEAKPRARSPKDDLFDVLTEFFGVARTRTEQMMYGKVVSELLEAGATSEETGRACEYVLRTFDSPSVFAVPKWFSASQRVKARLSPQEQMLEELRRKG